MSNLNDKENHDLVKEYSNMFDQFSETLEQNKEDYVRHASKLDKIDLNLSASAVTYNGLFGDPANPVPIVAAPLDSWDDEFLKRLRHELEDACAGMANIQDDLVEQINKNFLPNPKQGPIVWELRRRFSIEISRLRRIKAMMTPGMEGSAEGSYDDRMRELHSAQAKSEG